MTNVTSTSGLCWEWRIDDLASTGDDPGSGRARIQSYAGDAEPVVLQLIDDPGQAWVELGMTADTAIRLGQCLIEAGLYANVAGKADNETSEESYE